MKKYSKNKNLTQIILVVAVCLFSAFLYHCVSALYLLGQERRQTEFLTHYEETQQHMTNITRNLNFIAPDVDAIENNHALIHEREEIMQRVLWLEQEAFFLDKKIAAYNSDLTLFAFDAQNFTREQEYFTELQDTSLVVQNFTRALENVLVQEWTNEHLRGLVKNRREILENELTHVRVRATL